MKKIFKYGAYIALGLVSIWMLSSCNDWTDPEALKLNSPSFAEQNPQLYADYIKDLRNYKAGEHKVLFVSFNNPDNPTKQAERLIAIPDSVDYIVLNNPDNTNPETQEEMVKIREKGTRTIYMIDYNALENDWAAKQKADPELTEENALQYLGGCIDEKLALCDKYGYDGIMVDYTGRSLVSLTEPVLAAYNARQQNLFNRVMNWRDSHREKVLVFYGNVQYLVPENMSMLMKYDYIIPKTVTSTNADDLSVKIYLAIAAGNDAIVEEGEINPVPTDRFIVSVQFPQANDKNKIKGYWNTLDAKGEKIQAASGAALWVRQLSPDYTRSGIFILNIHNDYYNSTYKSVREITHIMNPNK